MTAVAPRETHEVAPSRPAPLNEQGRRGSKAWLMLTTTDHKQLGIMYMMMSFSLSLIHI